MSEPKLETKGNHRLLICYYNKKNRDWDGAIAKALAKFNLEPGQVPVICLPKKGKNHASKN